VERDGVIEPEYLGNVWGITPVDDDHEASPTEQLRRERERNLTEFTFGHITGDGAQIPEAGDFFGAFLAGPSRHFPDKPEFRYRSDVQWFIWGEGDLKAWDEEPPPPPPPGTWGNYQGGKPFDIALPFTADESKGGIIAFRRPDKQPWLAVTAPGNIGVFSWKGKLLWHVQDEIRLRSGASSDANYPGSCHAGFAVFEHHDLCAYVNEQKNLVVRDLRDGDLIRRIGMPSTGHGALVVVPANFGGGPVGVVQFGASILMAFDLETGNKLWESNRYRSLDHSPVICADVNNDGVDEVLGVRSLDANGKPLPQPQFPNGTAEGSMDALALGDVNGDGIVEMVVAEQGGRNATLCFQPSTGKLLWQNTDRPAKPTGSCAREIDPDKVALGNFISSSPGLETFVRSACGREPWLIDAEGKTIGHFSVEDVVPDGWNLGQKSDSEGGVDVVAPVDWHGNDHRNQIVVWKERHVSGWVQIVNLRRMADGELPKPGFRLNRSAIVCLPVDLAGDHREELVVLERKLIRIEFHDSEQKPVTRRRWDDPLYCARKKNWNYYSTS
jgi:outer membrane protein assembly factor BamB